jgi:hypothetical protein
MFAPTTSPQQSTNTIMQITTKGMVNNAAIFDSPNYL